MESSFPSNNQPPVSTPHFVVAKKRTSLIIKSIALFLIPLVGAIAGLFLNQLNQDIRQQASEGVYTTDSPSLAEQYQCSGTGGIWQNGACVRPTVISISAPDASGLCTNLVCPAGQTKHQVGGSSTICQCQADPTPTPTPIIVTGNGSGSCSAMTCAQGFEKTLVAGSSNVCMCVLEKNEIGDQCSNNSDCDSYNCLDSPGGKYCAPFGTTLSVKGKEGGACGTTTYNQQCEIGLVCSNSTCQKPPSTPTESDLAPLAAGTLAECAKVGGYWIQDSCWPTGTSTFEILARKNRGNNEVCNNDSQCQSGSCNVVGFKSICTPNVETITDTPRYDSGGSCQQDCGAQGGSEAVCKDICSEYNTSDENLLAVGQTINEITFGTFAEYVATNIELNDEGLTGWARYTDPRALEANTNFGLVLTAEGALAYTGVGALTGAGSAATFGATANLVNTGYSAYQAQQACSGATTAQQKKDCATAIAYTTLAGVNLGTSAYSLAAQSADDVVRAAQLANQARLVNAGASALEIGANTYQTYQACQGPNANSTGCLAQGALTIAHGLGSYGDLAYAAQQLTPSASVALELSVRDPLDTIARYTRTPRGTVPNSYDLQLGEFEELHPFQLRLIAAAQTENPTTIRTTYNEIAAEFEQQGVSTRLFNNVDEISDVRGADVTGYCAGTSCRGITTPTNVGLLSPEGLAQHYNLSPVEAYQVFAQKAGHEFGHAADQFAFSPSTSQRIFGVSPQLKNNLYLESEARQRFFNGMFYASTNQPASANSNFAVGLGLAGNPQALSANQQLTAQYRNYVPQAEVSQSRMSGVSSVTELQEEIAALGGVAPAEGVFLPPANLNRIIERVANGEASIDSLRRFPEIQDALRRILGQ